MAGRSALSWPFAINAWPNQPIGTGATYTGIGILVPRTGSNSIKSQEIPLGMDQTQASAQVWKNAGQHDPNRCLGSQGLFSPAINIPYNQGLLVPSSGDNYPPGFIGALTDGTGNLRYEGGNFAHCTNGGKVTAGHFGSYGTIVDNALSGGSGGSGISTLGGTIRYLEFTNGTNGVTATVSGYTFPTIRHALRIDLSVADLNGSGASPQIGPGYRWPANKADSGASTSYTGTNVQLCEGSLLAIPQSINLNSLGLTSKPGKQLAWTLQNFGCRPCNTHNGTIWAICTEWSAVGRVAVAPPLTDTSSEFFNLFGFPMYASPSTAFGADMNICIAHMAVVINDGPSNIGGGGTPLTTLAPAFGATISPPFLQQVNGNTSTAGPTLAVANTQTALGSALGLLVGARAPATASTPNWFATWTNTAQSGTGNTSVSAISHGLTAGRYVTAVISNRVASVGSITSVSDTQGNSYAQLSGAAITDTLADLRLEVWGAHVTTGGAAVVTANFAGTGAGGIICSEWGSLSEALDITVATATGSGTTIGPLSSGPTATANDLVIGAWAQRAAPTMGTTAFSPAGTTVNVPDTSVQATGTDNHLVGVSEIISGAAGNAQSFSITPNSSGQWVAIIICLSPTISGGSAPTVSISGGGTWTQAYSVNATTGLGNSSAWYLSPTGQVPANGITITSTSSTGSIEYEFYEIANGLYQAQNNGKGTSTAPTVQITPTATTDVQVGSIFWPNTTASITPTAVATWTSDATTQGAAANADSSIVSGGNVAASASAQTYNGTLSASSPWVAGILNFQQLAVPAQVAQPTIAAGQAQVSANWPTPNNNGSPLTSYTAKVYSGVAADGTGGSLASTITNIVVIDYSITPYVIGTLSNGTRYSVSITAVNGVGSSTESQRSLGATPVAATTAPGTPLAPAVLAGDTVATVTITPPSTGGLPIEGYTFNCYQGVTLISTQTQLSNVFAFSGLTDGTQYGFTGLAFNGNGNGLESPATLAIPVGAPATPNAPVCLPGNAQVTVTAQVPNNNGSGITGYTFNCYLNPSGTPIQTTTQAGLIFTFPNLNNGTPYYFTTLATNGVGTSSESAAQQSIPQGSAPPTPTPGQGRSVQQGTTYQYVYRGKTTHLLYKFAPSAVPTAVLDQFGNLLEYGTYNGETIVFCAQDGEPRRSVKGSPDASDPYGFGISVSPWESNV